MSRHPRTQRVPTLALDVYQPKPDVFYGLDAAARLAGVPRRSLLIYCRAGLVRAVLQAPHGVMAFTEEEIFVARRIERLRTVHGLSLVWIKTLFAMADEVERLREEVRFLRDR